jgi:two-component system, chemotaxis family, CheB/CheR fusion protein
MIKKTRKSAKKKSPPVKRAKARSNSKEKLSPKHFPIVAIGASAGGVEASRQLLHNLSGSLGMAYVFVHHLSPTYDSNLPEILQRETPMKVHTIGNRMNIEPNNVYVIPPKTFISIEDGQLMMRPRVQEDMDAIDFFMQSLASSYEHNAIGILLSGTASDGTLGLKAIKLDGGITFAQDESAAHREMPSHAQDAGYVDYVLPPQRIAEELAAIIQHPYAVASPNTELTGGEKEIKKILSIVLEKFDVDFFSHYKRTTVNRRIMRRMALSNIENIDQYVKKLRTDPHEVSALYNDFLINVTAFFREPAFYQALRKIVFPQLLKDRKSSDPIRIWVPGCATGEEAYSTAILLAEFLAEKKLSLAVQIFATDLDERAISKARVGTYSKNAVQKISATRLKQFFTKIDGHYQIAKSIRDMCTFSVHNLMKDPPFSRIDLVSCQNVLIYIEASPQRKILQAFHYALKPSGFLLLGKSESIGNALELFQPIEKDSRLYRKKLQAVLPRLDFSIRPHSTGNFQQQTFSEHRTESDVEKEFDKVLLARFVPASVLVNKDFEIIRFRGQTASYLQPASGKASLNLMKMIKEEYLFDLRTLVQKARKTNSPVVKEGIHAESGTGTIAIQVLPLKSLKESYYLIVFKPEVISTASALPKVKLSKQEQYTKIRKLEESLRDAREQVRTMTEDFDVSKEELQSANEEILSANEELQSINEELETSKEELQSANEELTTINEEFQARIEELKQSRDYANAIIETMHGPLVVLTGQMRVRTANKAFYDFFKLKQEDTEGQHIHDLSNGRWDIPALDTQLRQMFPKKIHFKDFEINHDFPGIGTRTMIVNAHRLSFGNGSKETQILLAFQDITHFRHAESDLREAQLQLKLALEGGRVGTWQWNIQTNELKGSKEQAELFGLPDRFFSTYDEWLKSIHADDVPEVTKAIHESILQQKILDVEFRIVRTDGDVRWLLSKANVYPDKNGKIVQMMGVNIDITERKRSIEALAESEKRFHTLSDQAPVMIWMSDAAENCNYLNKTWLSFTGKRLQEEIGKGWYKGIHPEDLEKFLEIYDHAYDDRKAFKTDYRFRRHDGEYRWIMAHGVPRYSANEFIGFIGTCIDITDRINLERQKDDFMSIASHELKTPVTSIKAYAQILHEKFKKQNDENSTMLLGRLDKQIDKLTGLINTLLDVARIQSGQMEYDYQRIDIKTFIKEVADEMQQTIPNHSLVLDFKRNSELVTDRARVSQVLNNLISNAAKYSPDSNKIVLTSDVKDHHFVFSVQDFGIGVPKEMHEQIFQRFFRVSESAGNRVSGLGLGLYISAQIIKQLGGNIWLQSVPGNGSIFSFSLPLNGKSEALSG